MIINNNLFVLLLHVTIAVFSTPLSAYHWLLALSINLVIVVLYIYIGTKLTPTESAFEDLFSVLSPSFIGIFVLAISLADEKNHHGSIGVIDFDPMLLWYLYNPIGFAPSMMVDWLDQPMFKLPVYVVTTLLPTYLLWVGIQMKRNLLKRTDKSPAG